MNEISPDIVSRCLLSNVRESVNALTELAESESGSSALLNLVKKTLIEDFNKAAQKIAEQINELVRKYNNRECVIAGVSPDVKAVRDENRCMDTGKTIWMDIKRIGIKRVGETAVFQLTIDDENVSGTGMPDEIAIRLFRAIDAFRTARNDKKAAHE